MSELEILEAMRHLTDEGAGFLPSAEACWPPAVDHTEYFITDLLPGANESDAARASHDAAIRVHFQVWEMNFVKVWGSLHIVRFLGVNDVRSQCDIFHFQLQRKRQCVAEYGCERQHLPHLGMCRTDPVQPRLRCKYHFQKSPWLYSKQKVRHLDVALRNAVRKGLQGLQWSLQ